ncbi:MAG: Rrf2 family transcriptional regulator, partial [Firmicutes bacterium]|nr:Rrf2 family transcriptional regulator [Bacillota bacterium]
AMAMLALHDGSGPLPLREIASKEEISFQFLEQIFPYLRRAGLICSVRGAKGGYYLARPPEQINVGDIVRAVEGPIVPVNCLAGIDKQELRCRRSEACRTRHVWEKLRDRINEVLDSVSLDELMGSRTDPLFKENSGSQGG